SSGDYAVLVVEHALDDLAAAVDRLVILDAGQVQFDAAPAEVLRDVDRLVAIGVRPPDASVIGIAAERHGLLPTSDHAFLDDDTLIEALAS
ncbi:MAG: hypothetical protein ABIO99_03185, partial [Candidatus Limnocylindria bacterium]